MKKTIPSWILLFALIISPVMVLAQKQTQNTSTRYSFSGLMESGSYWEAGLSVGAANAMTDISGPGENVSKTSLSSLNTRGISPAASAFARYRMNNFFALKASLGAIQLRGHDSWSSDTEIAQRGKFYNNKLYELGLLGEIYLPFGIFNPRRNFSLNSFDFFIFGGVSGFYHSPKLGGPIIDEYDLVLQTDPDAYNNWQAAVPFGAGFKWTIANSFSVGLDFNFRYTFVDYIDGFTRPVSSGNDMFFTTKFSLGFLLLDKSRYNNKVANRVVLHPPRPRGIR